MSILVVMDFIRENHISVVNGEARNVFNTTVYGKKLAGKLERGGVSKKDYSIDYIYPLVPEPKKVDKKSGNILKYKQPTMREWSPFAEQLGNRIVESKPTLVMPLGSIGCKYMLGKASITEMRGRPVNKEFTHSVTGEKYSVWILPTLSMEYLMAQPNIESKINADMVTLGKFVSEGEKAFLPSEIHYELLMDYDKVIQMFDMFKVPRVGHTDPRWLVAWDLETNSTRQEVLGAKPLVMSLSWEHGQGCTLPLEHRECTWWSKEQLDNIYKKIEDFMGDPNIIKVGHNIGFDIRFLMSTKGMRRFEQHRDTMVGYWMAVTQKLEDSFRLSDLAFELTDMGGYDDPLEQYKKEDIKRRQALAKEQEKEIKEQHKKDRDLVYKQALAEYEQLVKESKETGERVTVSKPKKSDFAIEPVDPSEITVETVNPYDGGNYNYEWFPLKVMHPYASGDSDACRRIHNKLIEIIKESPKMYNLFTDFYPRLTRTLARVESNGIAVNKDYMELINEKYTLEEERLLEEVRKLEPVKQLEEEHQALYLEGCKEFSKPPKERDKDIADLRNKYKGEKAQFNPNSADHKGRVFYDILGIRLPYSKESIKESAFDAGVPEDQLTWADYKTDKFALGHIVEHEPEGRELADLLLQHSKVKTLKNNFTSKLLKLISNKTGRIHGSYKITGTSTSRLSSKNPK